MSSIDNEIWELVNQLSEKLSEKNSNKGLADSAALVVSASKEHTTVITQGGTAILFATIANGWKNFSPEIKKMLYCCGIASCALMAHEGCDASNEIRQWDEARFEAFKRQITEEIIKCQ